MSTTGFVYDERTTKHAHPMNKHVEGPERVSKPFRFLRENGILNKCVPISPRVATKKELALVHDIAYIESVEMYNTSDTFAPCKLPEKWPSYICNDSYESASCATGATLNLIDAICTDQIQNGVAIVRPPGHHAETDEACGFCFFNSVAIATKYAQTVHNVNKILILDWDIHHGNGIQHVFYDDPNVLYVSLHRYDNGDYFPQLKEGNHDYVGTGAGEGFNVNIPWNKDLMGDAEYKMAFDRIVVPIVRQYKPDLILVAAGFDAAAADPLGEYILTSEMYAYMTQHLLSVGTKKLALILEGGYNPVSIGNALAACIDVMLNDKTVELGELVTPCKRALQTISSVIVSQSKYWNL